MANPCLVYCVRFCFITFCRVQFSGVLPFVSSFSVIFTYHSILCSKVQARMAFSSYLHRVQLRLPVESRTNSAWAQKDNDQMVFFLFLFFFTIHNFNLNIAWMHLSHTTILILNSILIGRFWFFCLFICFSCNSSFDSSTSQL